MEGRGAADPGRVCARVLLAGRTETPGVNMERAGDGRHGLNHARHEGGLLLRHCVIDRDAEALVGPNRILEEIYP
jgi:hypothetical protein